MRNSSLPILLVLLTVQMVLLVPSAHAAVEPKNLLRNGDFEEAGMPPSGWKIDVAKGVEYSLSPDALTGQKALKLSVPVPGNVGVVSDPCPVTAGDPYLFTYWYHTDGITGKGFVRFYTYLIWQDAAGKDIGSEFFEAPNMAVADYRVFSTTVPALPNAARVVTKFMAIVGADYAGQPCAFYVDQVRLMHLSAPTIPPNAQQWVYTGRMPSDTLILVADKDAVQGEALLATVGSGGYMTFGPYSMEQPVGDYVMNFRFKVKDNTRKAPVAYVDVVATGALGSVLARKTVLATDFKEPGVYQDIPLRFVRTEEGTMEFRVSYSGTTDLWYDSKTVVQLAAYPTDQEQAAIWLGGDTSGPPIAAPPATVKNSVLVLAGPDNRIYFPSDALTLTMQLKYNYSYLANTQTGLLMDQPLPKKLAKLNNVNLIVLAGVPAAALNGLMGRRTLRQFVERGGSLLVFGGPLSLGKGGFVGSAIEPVFPVTTTGGWDLVKAASPVVKVAKASPITRGLRWNQQPLVFYYQRIIPRSGAETLLTCSGAPILVTGNYGKGRVAVFAATDLGDPAAKQIPFYQWPDYLLLLTHVTKWLLKE
ncbi:MAG: glutamine amidotransferase [Armatimonadota bacterium]